MKQSPRTNNLAEIHFRTTLSQALKKTFKTVIGLEETLEIHRMKWNKRVLKIPTT